MTYCNISFSSIQSSGSSAGAYVTASANWDAYQNNRYYSTVIHFDSSNEFITLEHTGHNTWRYTFPVTNAVLTINFTSENTAEVHEEGTAIVKDSYGSYTYEYNASYSMTKDFDSDNDNDSEEFGISIISGRWSGTEGTGTAAGSDGNFDLKLEGFTALLSNLNEGDSSASMYVKSYTSCGAYQDGEYITTTARSDNEEQLLTLQHTGTNTWSYAPSDSQQRIIIKFTSRTTAEIHEGGRAFYEENSHTYNYNISYTVFQGILRLHTLLYESVIFLTSSRLKYIAREIFNHGLSLSCVCSASHSSRG